MRLAIFRGALQLFMLKLCLCIIWLIHFNLITTTLSKPPHTEIAPWFGKPMACHSQSSKQNTRIAVIGCGLAGLMSAYHLQEAGFQVELFDEANKLPNRQCQNPAMILRPYLSPDLNFFDQYYTAGFLGMQRFILQHIPSAIISTGMQDFLVNEKKQTKAIQLAQKRDINDFNHLTLIVNPEAITTFLLQQFAGKVHLGTQQDPLLLKQQFDTVIIATGSHSEFGIPKPGQVSIFPENRLSANQQALSYQGYCLPTGKGQRILGSSFRSDTSLEVRQQDHLQNLACLAKADAKLAKAFEADLTKVDAFVGMRYTTLDHLPVIGGFPIQAEWLKAYERLRHGDRRPAYPPCPYYDGLYLNLAHGSKGLSSSFMASQILTALLTGRPLPIGVKLWEAIHPARFWLRNLKHA